MTTRLAVLLPAVVLLMPGVAVSPLAASSSASTTAEGPSLTVAGSPLAGATVGADSVVTARGTDVAKVKWVLDGGYLGADTTAPFTWSVAGRHGRHELSARAYASTGVRTSTRVTFTLGTGGTAPIPGPMPTPTPTPTPGAGPTVSSSAGLVEALATARPGSVISLADGTYTASSAFTIATRCTAAAPCVLHGGRGAVLSGHGITGVYGLHLAGASYWTVSGLTVAGAAKGVVLDASQHNALSGLDVHEVGDEGIHLRSASSDNLVTGTVVHDTGKRSPGYGEGVYVGSASSNWGTYSAGAPDRSDRNVVTRNVISRTGAESVDIKEGTTGGTLSDNVFDGAAMSGANFADSWVDLKGNDWVVSGNHGTHALLDGFQTHVAVPGWGRGNVFRGNVADTGSTGYGFRITDPATSGNLVYCDNTAPHARAGLANLACR